MSVDKKILEEINRYRSINNYIMEQVPPPPPGEAPVGDVGALPPPPGGEVPVAGEPAAPGAAPAGEPTPEPGTPCWATAGMPV